MKNLTALLSLFFLLTAFTCENEPLEGEFGVTCESAELSSESAEQAFMDATEANYSELCNAYKLALVSQIETCGDDDGNLQTKIDILGDCTLVTPPDDCETATQAVDQAQANFDLATEDNYTLLCNALKTALEAKIEFCQDPDGSIQAEIDGLGNCTQDNNNTSVGCNDLQMFDIFNQPVQCSYDLYQDFEIVNAYVAEGLWLIDEDGDGIDDHALTRIFLTDGTATFDVDNQFVSFSDDRTFVFTLILVSRGTSGLIADDYLAEFDVDANVDSYLSIASDISYGDCMSDSLICNTQFALLNGVATVSGNPGNFEICFDTYYWGGNCFNRTYSGVLTPFDW